MSYLYCVLFKSSSTVWVNVLSITWTRTCILKSSRVLNLDTLFVSSWSRVKTLLPCINRKNIRHLPSPQLSVVNISPCSTWGKPKTSPSHTGSHCRGPWEFLLESLGRYPPWISSPSHNYKTWRDTPAHTYSPCWNPLVPDSWIHRTFSCIEKCSMD